MAIIAASDLKTHLGISDSTDDTSITMAAAAACTSVQEWCGRSFETVTTGSASARQFYSRSSSLTYCDDFWTTSALTVKTDTADDGTYATSLTVNTDFVVEPVDGLHYGLTVPYYRLRMVGGASFPWLGARPNVQVTAAWGWAAVPEAVKQAALIKAAKLFKRRNSPEGVLGGFGDFGAVRVSNREDPDVVGLLGPFRRPEIGAGVFLAG